MTIKWKKQGSGYCLKHKHCVLSLTEVTDAYHQKRWEGWFVFKGTPMLNVPVSFSLEEAKAQLELGFCLWFDELEQFHNELASKGLKDLTKEMGYKVQGTKTLVPKKTKAPAPAKAANYEWVPVPPPKRKTKKGRKAK